MKLYFDFSEFSLLSLFVIAIGTGAVTSSLAAFGGEQFIQPQQKNQLQRYFSMFYFASNGGIFIFIFVSPFLRENVHCFDQKSCYSLAFGASAILTTIALGNEITIKSLI